MLGDADKEGWKRVKTTYQGENFEGVISGSFLRPPESEAKEKLLAAGAVEWDRFQRGEGKENQDPFFKFVGEMWKNLGVNDLDGKDTETPWSAACISFMVKKAGYTHFKADPAHSVYVHDAIVARLSNKQDRDFWGFRLSEHQPQIGDLVCRKRSTAPITFDFAANHDGFISHCDMVVAVNGNSVEAVGGNVRNSVSITSYKRLPNGQLDPNGGRVYAILRNNN